MDLYSLFRNNLSNRNRGRLSKVLFSLGLKPKVNHGVQSPLDKGIVTLSADFEMAWAFRYSKSKASQSTEMGIKERMNVPVLLKLFDSYKIPVTWATVGHLFLSECQNNPVGLAHPDMARPGFFENVNWSYKIGDWYQHDPCTNYLDSPAWYAPDLIEQIMKAEAKHEIACHTFSHLDFTYGNCTPELASSELNKCINLAEKLGIILKTMVFPGGTAGHFEILKEKGFTCYRKPTKHHIDLPYIDDFGLVAIPSSINLDKDPYGWSSDFHLKLIKKYIEESARNKMVCHFWFHPSMDLWYLKNVLPGVLELLNEFSNHGEVEVLTMGQLADKVLNKYN